MAPTFSVRHCIAAESRSFCDIPGISAVLDRFDSALQEALQTSADLCELPASVITDCDPHWSNTAINLLGPAVVWHGARTEDGRAHTGSGFIKLLVETAREIKAGSPTNAGNAVAFYGFNLDVIRASSTMASLASHYVVEQASIDAPANAQRRRAKP